MILIKKCTICDKDKPLEDFYKNSKSKDKLFPYCKKCALHKSKKYRQDNKEKVFISCKRYYKNNRESILKRQKSYNSINKEEILTKKTLRRNNFPEIRNAHNNAFNHIKVNKNQIRHHWCYEKDYWLDVIILDESEHLALHRFMYYDQDIKKYRSKDHNKILYKKDHLELLSKVQQINNSL